MNSCIKTRWNPRWHEVDGSGTCQTYAFPLAAATAWAVNKANYIQKQIVHNIVVENLFLLFYYRYRQIIFNTKE